MAHGYKLNTRVIVYVKSACTGSLISNCDNDYGTCKYKEYLWYKIIHRHIVPYVHYGVSAVYGNISMNII